MRSRRGRVWVRDRKREQRTEREGERAREGGWGQREGRGEGDHRVYKLTMCMSLGLGNYRLARRVESRVYHNTAQMMTAYTTHMHTNTRTHRQPQGRRTHIQQQLPCKVFKQLLHISNPQNSYIHAHFSKPPSGSTACFELLSAHKTQIRRICKCKYMYTHEPHEQ